MNSTELAREACQSCNGAAPMDAAAATEAVADLPCWQLSADAGAITRRFDFKGFARAVEMANLAAWLGNSQNHHPDIRFGWGYCEVTFTTHDAGGLTRNDLICAARLDALVGGH